MIIPFLFILLIAIVVFIGLRAFWAMFFAKTIYEKIAGGILVAILLSISLLFVYLIDSLPAANDRARLIACSQNMERMFEAMSQYKEEYGEFPSSLNVVSSRAGFYSERNGPMVPYSYEQPQSDTDFSQPCCWCSTPHHIRHKWLHFRDRKIVNVLYPDGTIKQEKTKY